MDIFLRALIDISIITAIIYRIISFSFDQRILGAILFFSGIFILNILASILKLPSTAWVSEKISEYTILTLIIIFHPEIRRIILGIKIGGLKIKREILEEVVSAIEELIKKRCGAIIVFEGRVNVEPILSSFKELSTPVSKDVILYIFEKGSPFHDGAIIIRRDKIVFVSAILPISSKNVGGGVRHRAGVGITENSDAISIIVSESGKVSLAYRGEISGIEPKNIPQKIEDILKAR